MDTLSGLRDKYGRLLYSYFCWRSDWKVCIKVCDHIAIARVLNFCIGGMTFRVTTFLTFSGFPTLW